MQRREGGEKKDNGYRQKLQYCVKNVVKYKAAPKL